MAHPRADYHVKIVEFYLENGADKTCTEYRTSGKALRKWLVRNGITLRKQGECIHRGTRKKKAVDLQATTAYNDESKR